MAVKDDAGKETPNPAAETPKPNAAGQQPPADGKGKETPAPAGDGKDGAAAEGAGGKDGGDTPKPKADTPLKLTVPEGAETFIGDEDVTRVLELAKANGWTQEQAQTVLESTADDLAEQSRSFREATEADPVYGGKNLEATQQHASRALAAMWPKDSQEFKDLGKLLQRTGYGNHRLIVGGLANLGKLMAEDSGPVGGSGGGAKRDPVEVLYGQKS